MTNSRLLVGILLLSAFLRLYNLGGESLWLDEGFTARRAHASFIGLLHEFKHETQTGLYYFGEKIWCAAFGTSEASLRFPSVIFGVLAVWGVFLAGRVMFGPGTALCSALLLAVNPFAVFYSQEARPYSLFLAAAVFSVYFTLCLLRRPHKGWMLGYAVATTIALYSHPLGPLLLLVHGTAWLVYRNDERFPAARGLRVPLQSVLLVVLLYLPQLALMWRTVGRKIAGTSNASWIPVPSPQALMATVLHYFMLPQLLPLAGLCIAAGLIFSLRNRERGSGRGLLVLLSILLAFIAAPWVTSRLLTPIYVDRYTIPALAGIVLGLGWALCQFPRPLRVILVVVWLVLSGFTLGKYYTGLDKEPWREAAQWVQRNAQPGDVVILNAFYTRDTFSYYFHDYPGVRVIAPRTGDRVPQSLLDARHVLLVQSYEQKHKQVLDTLMPYILQNRAAGPTTIVEGRWPRYSWAFWTPDIRVTRFEQTAAPVTPAADLGILNP